VTANEPGSNTGSLAGSAAAALLACLERDDLVGATDTLGAVLSSGTSMPTVIDDVVTPVMVEVGRQWETNQWSVAQEHGATATVDAALAAVEGRYPVARSAGRPVVVACAEGEWHTLPARLAAHRLRAEGHNVLFLGPSLPPDHLDDYLLRVRASVFALSCTLSANLIGARRCVEAAHTAAVPVIVGGAAFDPAGRRAEAIGADALHNASGNTAFLNSPYLQNVHQTRSAIKNRQEAFDIEIGREAVVDAAMADMNLHYLAHGADDHRQHAQT
jgi:methanogenic corrinoid protein MtbC1